MNLLRHSRHLPFAIAALLMLMQPAAAQAQSTLSRASMEKMFAQMAQANIDTSRPLLWGYFFTNGQRPPLEMAAKDLSKLGYQVVKIYLSDKKNPTDPDKWWLHVERVEHHTVASLDARNIALEAFAKNRNLASYDGMDVGPVNGGPF